MVLEAASIRLAIDLFYSSHKLNFIVSDIKFNIIDKNQSLLKKSYIIFDNFDLIKNYYLNNYSDLIHIKQDVFTNDINKARLEPLAKYGLFFDDDSNPYNLSNIQELCNLGSFYSLNNFNIEVKLFSNDYLKFNCLLNINKNNKLQVILHKNINNIIDFNQYQKTIENLIKIYQKLLNKLYEIYLSDIYVDFHYVNVGYTKESTLIYNAFFNLIKDRLDTGLRENIFNSRYLLKK